MQNVFLRVWSPKAAKSVQNCHKNPQNPKKSKKSKKLEKVEKSWKKWKKVGERKRAWTIGIMGQQLKSLRGKKGFLGIIKNHAKFSFAAYPIRAPAYRSPEYPYVWVLLIVQVLRSRVGVVATTPALLF